MIFGATAGKGGHAGIQARSGQLDNTPDACPPINLIARAGGAIAALVGTVVIHSLVYLSIDPGSLSAQMPERYSSR